VSLRESCYLDTDSLLERTHFNAQIKCSSKFTSARLRPGFRMGLFGRSDGNLPGAYGG
jgi:hypothetical protein